MFRSGLVKSARVAITLSGFGAPPAGAIEMVQGSGPAADLSDGLISKVVVVRRGVTAVGPRGGVYHRGGTWAGPPLRWLRLSRWLWLSPRLRRLRLPSLWIRIRRRGGGGRSGDRCSGSWGSGCRTPLLDQ